MEFQKITLATFVAALMFSPVQANQEKGEKEDSVTEWGPWALPVPTAAGPGAATPPLLLLGGTGPEHVFFNPDLELDVGDPDDGSEFREYMAWDSRNKHGDDRYVRASFSKLLEGFDGAEGSASVDFSVGTEEGDQTYNPDTYDPNNVLSGNRDVNGAYYSNGRKIWHDKEELQYSAVFNDVFEEQELEQSDVAFIKGYWTDYDTKYLFGFIPVPVIGDKGRFILGNTSTLDSINEVLAGNSFAEYSGAFLEGGKIHISIEFGGDVSWSGHFKTPGTFGTYFEVNDGVIDGVDLSGAVDHTNNWSTRSFRYEQNVVGEVDASFFGDNAQFINGIADIDQETNKIRKSNGQIKSTLSSDYVGVFTTEGQLGVQDNILDDIEPN